MSLFDLLFRAPAESESRVIEHPRLGTLEFDGENFWLGNIVVDGFPLEITLDWQGNGFPPGHDAICVWVIDNFSEINQKAQERLRKTVQDYKSPVDLTFTPSEILWIWNDGPAKHFTIRFNDDHDEYKLWRVEFRDLETVGCGYDD